MRLAKEDSMDDDGPILTANSHSDNILCNRCFPIEVLRPKLGTETNLFN